MIKSRTVDYNTAQGAEYIEIHEEPHIGTTYKVTDFERQSIGIGDGLVVIAATSDERNIDLVWLLGNDEVEVQEVGSDEEWTVKKSNIAFLT